MSRRIQGRAWLTVAAVLAVVGAWQSTDGTRGDVDRRVDTPRHAAKRLRDAPKHADDVDDVDEATTHPAPADGVLMNVRNVKGRPIVDVVVTRRRKRSLDVFHADAQGRVQLNADADLDIEFVARALGYATVTLAKPVRHLTMKRDYSVAGIVVNRQGEPMPNIRVAVSVHVLGAGQHSCPDEQVRTDAHGKFSCRGVPFGQIRISSYDSTYFGEASYVVAGTKDARLTVQRRTRVRGHVVDTNGAAVEDASVYMSTKPNLGPTGIAGLACLETTAADGSFEIDADGVTRAFVVASFQGRVSAVEPVTLVPEETVGPITLRLSDAPIARSYVAVQLVNRHSEPLPDVLCSWALPAWLPALTRRAESGRALARTSSIELAITGCFTSGPRDRTLETGTDGKFRVSIRVPPGTRILVTTGLVETSGETYTVRHPRRTVSVVSQADADTPAVKIVIPDLVRRSFRVQHEDGTLAPDDLLVIGPAFNHTVDEVSELLTLDLDPQGPFRLATAFDGTIRVFEPDWKLPDASSVIDVRLPNRTSQNSDKKNHARRGRVVDAQGEPIVGAVVAADFREVVTGHNGEFRLKTEQATTPLSVRAPRCGRTRVTDTSKPIVLRAPGSISISVRPPSAWRGDDWVLDVVWPTGIVDPHAINRENDDRFEIIEPGPFGTTFVADDSIVAPETLQPGARGTLDDLAPGQYELRLITDRFRIVKTITVHAGKTTRVEFAPR